MILRGTIFDNTSKKVIPFASVSIVDPAGHPTGAGVISDAQGQFYINTTFAEYPNFLQISSAGYMTASAELYDDFNIDFAGEVYLNRSVKELENVTIVSNKNNNNWLWALAVVPFLVKKRSAAVGKIELNLPTVIAAGAGIAIIKGFSFFDNILAALGLGKDKDDTAFQVEAENPNSPFLPNYFPKASPADQTKVYSEIRPRYLDLVDTLNSAFGFFSDDEAVAIGVFKSFRSKLQVACFCYIWQVEFSNPPILDWLKGDTYPNDRLDTGEINEIIKFVNNLPAK